MLGKTRQEKYAEAHEGKLPLTLEGTDAVPPSFRPVA